MLRLEWEVLVWISVFKYLDTDMDVHMNIDVDWNLWIKVDRYRNKYRSIYNLILIWFNAFQSY